MTGPEHYQHAEQLLDWASDAAAGSRIEAYNLRAARAHATLALAAATALSRPHEGMPAEDWKAWHRAAAAPAAAKENGQ